LESDGQILANVDRISHIPGVIVQGRYDMICPPKSAYDLAQAWPNAELRMVRNAGHALSEPGISAELVRAMDQIGEDYR
jgi:proline iminopeptidase